MLVSLLLCELRVERAPFPHEPDAAVILSRLSLLLRHARQTGWGVAHVAVKRHPSRGGAIPGLEPLRSEAVFSVGENGAVDPRPLLETLSDRPIALAGFGYRDIIAPVLAQCVRNRQPAILVDDATGWGPERAFALRALSRDGVGITTADSLIRSGAGWVLRS